MEFISDMFCSTVSPNKEKKDNGDAVPDSTFYLSTANSIE